MNAPWATIKQRRHQALRAARIAALRDRWAAAIASVEAAKADRNTQALNAAYARVRAANNDLMREELGL